MNEISFNPVFAVIYKELSLRGLRTFPQKKKRQQKKELKKRDNIVGTYTFNSKNEADITIQFNDDGLAEIL